jgi:hypothetical protein
VEIFDLMSGTVLERPSEHRTARAFDETASLGRPLRSSLVEVPARLIDTPELKLIGGMHGAKCRRKLIVMNYVQRVLQPGEQVRHISSIHWIVYFGRATAELRF